MKGGLKERWFAVCCKPRQEMAAQENLLRQGFQVYLPRIQMKKRRQGKWVDVIEALFPRYIFIRADPNAKSLASVRSTRGAVGLVRFGGQPAVIADELMDDLQQRENALSHLHQNVYPQFCAGEAVRLVEGPFADMDGIFMQEDGDKRVIVLLEMLGKVNKVRVKRDLVERVA